MSTESHYTPSTSSRAPGNYSPRIPAAGSEALVQLRPGGGRSWNTGGKQVLEYRVRWKGCGANDDTWEPEGHLEHYGPERMLKKYKMKTGLVKANAVVCDAFTPSFRATI